MGFSPGVFIRLLEVATIAPDPNVGSTGHMRGRDRQYSATNTRPDGHLESGFFFEFPHKAGLGRLVDLFPTTGQFPFLPFISQEEDL